MNTTINAVANSNATIDGMGWLQRRAPKQFNQMDGMLEFLRERSAQSSTLNIKSKAFDLITVKDPQDRNDMNRLGVVVNGQPREFTHWSFNQLCSLAKAPVDFMRRLPAQLVDDNVSYCLKFIREVEDVKVFSDASELRAITGPGYGRVHDHEVLAAAQSILDTGRWVPANGHMGMRATDRSLQLFLIDEAHPIVVGRAPNGQDDVMYRGLRISNSEVGLSSLAVDGFFFRSYCMNGMIFGLKEAERITVRHSKSAPQRWAAEVKPSIEAYANTDGMKLVEAVKLTKEAIVAKDDDGALNFLKNLSFSKARASEIMERVTNEEGRPMRTAWDAVQGITAFARTIEGTEERADVERIAGRVWERAARHAA